MGKGSMKARLVRNAVFATAVAGSMLALTQTALADNGGNGEGKLAIFSTSDVKNAQEVASLQWGGTYYIELENPGKQSRLWNELNAPTTVVFNFFNPPSNFKGDPGHWDLSNYTFKVTGSEVDGKSNSAPFVYKVTLPGAQTASQKKYGDGNYAIETGQVAMHHNGVFFNNGEDEMYFSRDPKIGGAITIYPPTPAGQLPEVPYAGIIPAIVLAGGGLLYLRRRRQTRA